MDAWAVLGVPPGSSERAIRAAYLRRSKQLHPDLGGTDEAMRDLNAAYAEATSPSVAPPTPPSPPPAGDQFVSRPRPVAARPKVRKPRKRFYKRPVFYLLAGVFVAFVLTSGATDDPSPENRPAVYGLIGRCVNIVDRDI
ncbi:MAG: J domain-containing protein, partial [Acidimicrobiales bacterium]|nr:J domain-containing protein [Acidimicrobiales bacterium]